MPKSVARIRIHIYTYTYTSRGVFRSRVYVACSKLRPGYLFCTYTMLTSPQDTTNACAEQYIAASQTLRKPRPLINLLPESYVMFFRGGGGRRKFTPLYTDALFCTPETLHYLTFRRLVGGAQHPLVQWEGLQWDGALVQCPRPSSEQSVNRSLVCFICMHMHVCDAWE